MKTSELCILEEHISAVNRLLGSLYTRHTLGHRSDSYKKLIARLQDERNKTYEEIRRLEAEEEALDERLGELEIGN